VVPERRRAVTRKIINQVQEYLTYCGDDRVYQIVNVEVLLKRHPPEDTDTDGANRDSTGNLDLKRMR
jgi:hypothetical protein